jgi:hypothetical protein
MASTNFEIMEPVCVTVTRLFIPAIYVAFTEMLGLRPINSKTTLMKKRIVLYLKHLVFTVLLLIPVIILAAYVSGAALKYDADPQVMNWNNEGPHVFYVNDSIVSVNYVRGDMEKGFSLDRKEYPRDSARFLTCYYPLDSSRFTFSIQNDHKTPDLIYEDNNPILAISDIEGNYRRLRDFLLNSHVIDSDLNWTFGNGHLVLVGDFVDRGYFVTQVLWFIYRLEQEAEKQGGRVHYIVGNHELKTMQGDYMVAAPKYYHVGTILEKQQHELYNSESVIGNWLASKNALELINGKLFVHGGIHPDVANSKLSLEELNQMIRANYSKPFYPKVINDLEQLIVSSKTGPCWYRGYFRDDLTQEEVDKGLAAFNARTIVVGHTIQRKVNRRYNGKVIGIDVQHPQDQFRYLPNRRSEALLIEGGKYYRVLDTGVKEEI